MDHLSSDPFFERIYLAHFLRDPEFYHYVKEDIKPEFFQSPTVQRLIRLILQFGQEIGTPPGDLITHELEKHKLTLSQDTLDGLLEYSQSLLAIDLRDRQYLFDEHDKFLKGQVLKQMVPKLVEYGRKGDHDAISKLFQDYIAYKPKGLLAPGQVVTNDVEARCLRRAKQQEEDRFYFLIPKLDQLGIAFRRHDLVAIQSQKSSVGKTTFLACLARSLVFQNKRVMVYTLEESEDEFIDRLDQAISGLNTEELSDRVLLEAKMHRWISSSLRVKEFDAYETKVSDLIAHHQMLQNYFGYRPDVVIINAADYLCADRFRDSMYAEGRDIYRSLKAWARRANIAVVVDMQSNRGAAEKVVADQADASGSIAKVHLATHLLTLNRSPAETKENMTTINVAKYRNGQANIHVSFHSDLSRGQIYVPSHDE